MMAERRSSGLCSLCRRGSTLGRTSAPHRTNAFHELYNELTSNRFLQSCYMLLGVRKCLARVSELTQRDNLSQYSLKKKVNQFVKGITNLQQSPGGEEKAFIEKCDRGRQIYRGIQVLNEGKGVAATDRAGYLKAIEDNIIGKVLLKGPIHEARAELFDFDEWLDQDDQAPDYLHNLVKVLSSHFSHFGDGWEPDLLSEWSALVKLVQECRQKKWKHYSYAREGVATCLAERQNW